MFNLIGDLVGAAGNLVGSVVGLSVGVLAEALSIPARFIQEALDAGCESQEDVRLWCQRNREW